MRIISIYNQKGGVGKTATAINLSCALLKYNKRVLLIDLDPQGDATSGIGMDPTLISVGSIEVLNKQIDINKAIKKTNFKGLEILPSKVHLSFEENRSLESFTDMKENLNQLDKPYDYIILDCPPSLGYLSINALTASNSVIIPIQCEYFAMQTASRTVAAISKIQRELNSSLEIEGFLFTMRDFKTNNDIEIVNEVKSLFRENTFFTQIPRNISLAESNAMGLPVIEFRPTSSSALAYIELAKEIVLKEKN